MKKELASWVSNAPTRSYRFADGVQLDIGRRTLIMGILNATPDSFSDGGRFNVVEHAIAHATEMVSAGADIIDIGGESTRPGATPVPEADEIARVIPIIRALREHLPHVPLSIDTYKANTAEAALEAGAHIINDVWALQKEARMVEVAARFQCPVILSHNRTTMNYDDVVTDVIADLQQSIALAQRHGVLAHHIWLDPGIGFAKTYHHNLELMNRLAELTELGYPVLLGTSRKRFIRETLQLPVDELLFGTAATVALGIAQGCQIVRVHDVKEMKQTATMIDQIVYDR